LKKLACHEKESALEDYFLSLLLPLIGRRSRRMRELKELCPHPSRPVGTPSPGEAGEGKDRFLSFLAFSTSLLRGVDSRCNRGDGVCLPIREHTPTATEAAPPLSQRLTSRKRNYSSGCNQRQRFVAEFGEREYIAVY